MRAGDYLEADAAFRESLVAHAHKFTMAVGVYCDSANVAGLLAAAGGPQDLILLRLTLSGRICHGLYWGLFDSRAEAHDAAYRVPAGLRASGQHPIAVSSILARPH